jgi:GNAT superfamily N-acetyltransferase
MFLRSMTGWVLDHLSTHVPLVAEVDGRISGMAWLALVIRVPSPRLADRRTGALQAVYIVPVVRNQGVGAALALLH